MIRLKKKLDHIQEFFEDFKNSGKYSSLSSGVKLAYENYKRANSSLWVTSLCYYTVLSMAPLSAILFSLGNWLGMGDYLINKLVDNSPLNDDTIELLRGFADRLLDNARNGVLAGIGFLFLGWTLISMFSIVEKSFNDIWQVKKARIIFRKITDYFAFIVFTPVFILAVNGLTILVGRRFHNLLFIYLIKIVPYIAILVFFTALYMIMPNTNVRFVPAFLSGIFTSILCTCFQYFFFYLQGMINTYNKIYGGFAILFIFVFWMRILWFFIILGGHLSYFLQNKDLAFIGWKNNFSFRSKEYIALLVMTELIKRYINNEPPITSRELSKEIKIPYRVAEGTMAILKDEGILAEVADNDKYDNSYIMAKNVDTFTYGDLCNALELNGRDINFESYKSNNTYLEIIKNKEFNKRLIDLVKGSS